MPDYRNLLVCGKVTDDGELPITEIGFTCGTEAYPSYGASPPNITWNVALSNLKPDGVFCDTITGLTPATFYYVRSYARNSIGLSESNNTDGETTTGIINKPTVTCYIMLGNISKLIYEIGTNNYLTVSGETTQLDETIFNHGELNQTSQPPPLSNPIRSWTGYQPTYSTATPLPSATVNFSPVATNILTQQMTQAVTYYCGSPEYTITASTIADAFFPYLWVLKPTFGNNFYFNGPWDKYYTGNYFYKDASVFSNTSIIDPAFYTHGKLINKKDQQQFLMAPSSTSTKYLSLGYPASYGNCQMSFDGSTWFGFPNYNNYGTGSTVTYNVDTGLLGYTFGIQNRWIVSYKIVQFNFQVLNTSPILFYIKFE